jgi:hypothetical protein
MQKKKIQKYIIMQKIYTFEVYALIKMQKVCFLCACNFLMQVARKKKKTLIGGIFKSE